MTEDQEKKTTKLLVWGAIGILTIWELIVVISGKYNALITPYVKKIRNYPLMVVVFGVLVAHFIIDPTRAGAVVKNFCYRNSWVSLLIGIAIGMVFWPSKR
jgi:hypothetical protein